MKKSDEDDQKKYAVGEGYTYKHSVIRMAVSATRPKGCEECWMVKSVTQKVLSEMEKGFEPRAGDTFLCTYIKSGTTWVQAIMRELIDLREGTDTRVEGISVGLAKGDRIPWIENRAASEGPATFLKTQNETPRTKRRMYKTHCPYPIVKRWSTKGTKFIFVVRDPRDVVVSAWHHTRTKNFTYKGPFEHFAHDMFLKGRLECGDWFRFTKECYEACAQNSMNTLLLRYEDMMKDPKGSVERIARFMDVEVTDANVKDVVRKTSFDSMRRAEAKGGLRIPGWSKRKMDEKVVTSEGSKAEPSKRHIRKGGVGRWKEYFDDGLLSKFREKHESVMGTKLD